MQLPPALRRAVEVELAAFGTARLRAAAARLSECYRTGAAPAAMSAEEHRAAYLAVRLPATYAAVHAALRWSAASVAGEFTSVLDLGSGPGTALWAAAELFPSLHSAAAVERDTQLIAIARRLASASDSSALLEAAWIQGDLNAALPEARYDLVLCSYAMNELKPEARIQLVRRAWARTQKMLIFIEPGTKAGFANILAARNALIHDEATLAAPCPHALACPMAGEDWCHFAARVERSAEHRRLKDAELGHEDEKFSYVAFARDSATPCAARIVRHPRIFSGYTQLALCQPTGLTNITVTRSQKEDWRRLRRLSWGDRW